MEAVMVLDPKEYIPEELSAEDFGFVTLQNFNEFRETGLFCDFQLRVGFETFNLHRMVLAGCSDYFRALFSHGMQDSNTSGMTLEDVTLDGMRPLVHFAYTGRISLSLANISDILAAATFLQITLAIKLCTQFLKTHMTFANAQRLVELACNHGLTELKSFCTDMILDNFFEYAQTSEFLKLDAATLADYLEKDELRTPTEGQLLLEALRWYNHASKERHDDIYQVMEKIRFTIDGWPTIAQAMDVPPFTNNKECAKLLEWCHRFMRNTSRKHLVKSHRTRVRFHRRTLVQIGGIHMQNSFYIAEDDMDMIRDRGIKSGCGRNNYYHRGMNVWLPIGVVASTEGRSHAPLVEVNDYGILVGGYIYSEGRHATSDVSLFTPGSFALWDLKPMQQERAQHVAILVPGNMLYVIGGKDDDGPLKSVERFNMEQEKWTFVQPLRKTLYDHCGCCLGQTVYVSGGVEAGKVSDKFLSYNPFTDVWQELIPMTVGRCNHVMATCGSTLLVCGGRMSLASAHCLASVEAYSVELQQWTHITPMRIDCCDMTPVVLEGNILVVGGENSVGDILSTIQEYNPRTRTWGTFGELPFAAKNIGCCALTIKETSFVSKDTDIIEVCQAKYLNSDDSSTDLDSNFVYEEYMPPGWLV